MVSEAQSQLDPNEQFARIYLDLYEFVAKRLRSSKPFRKALATAVTGGGCHSRLDEAHQLWPDPSIGHVLASVADSNEPTDLIKTACWFLAVRSGETVRAILPIHRWKAARKNMLLWADSPAALTREHVLRAMHATINISFAMRRAGRNEAHEGMLMGALTSGQPIYCGDVSHLGTKKWTIGDESGQTVQFFSTVQKSEKYLGMASVLYVPMRFDEDKNILPADLVLGVYSPIPHLFGEANEPRLFMNDIGTKARSAILKSPAPILFHSLFLNDYLLGRDGVRLALSSLGDFLTQTSANHLHTLSEHATGLNRSQIRVGSSVIAELLLHLTTTHMTQLLNGSLSIHVCHQQDNRLNAVVSEMRQRGTIFDVHSDYSVVNPYNTNIDELAPLDDGAKGLIYRLNDLVKKCQ